MKKIILAILCLFIISMGLACVAASDNSTMTADSIQNTDQQHITVADNMTVENDLNDTSANVIDTDISDINSDSVKTTNDTQNNTNSTSDYKLNIVGPKLPDTKDLNITGPKNSNKKLTLMESIKDWFNPIHTLEHYNKTPVGLLNEIEILTFHYAKDFGQNPDLTLHDCVYRVLWNQDYHYTLKYEKAKYVVMNAHNMALHKYPNKNFTLNKELTIKDMENFNNEYHPYVSDAWMED